MHDGTSYEDKDMKMMGNTTLAHESNTIPISPFLDTQCCDDVSRSHCLSWAHG